MKGIRTPSAFAVAVLLCGSARASLGDAGNPLVPGVPLSTTHPATTVPPTAFKISKCSANGQKDVGDALQFIASNLELILSEMDALSKSPEKFIALPLEEGPKEVPLLDMATKAKLRKQFATVSVVCIDKYKACLSGKILGRAHGVLTNRVSICYDSHVSWSTSRPELGFCELVDTVFHEAGHTLGIRCGDKLGGCIHHGVGDRIYGMGAGAKHVCRMKRAARALVGATSAAAK